MPWSSRPRPTGTATALALTAGLSAVPANAADTGNATLEAIKQCESGGDYRVLPCAA
jgi:hypothetical protein